MAGRLPRTLTLLCRFWSSHRSTRRASYTHPNWSKPRRYKRSAGRRCSHRAECDLRRSSRARQHLSRSRPKAAVRLLSWHSSVQADGLLKRTLKANLIFPPIGAPELGCERLVRQPLLRALRKDWIQSVSAPWSLKRSRLSPIRVRYAANSR